MILITDWLNFIKTLTAKRLWNAVRVFFNYWVSQVIRKPIINHYPYSLSLEPTNLCNLNCPECPTGLNLLTRRQGYMRFDLFEKILEETSPFLLWLMLYFQGESFLHPDLHLMIEYAKKRSVYVHVSTNGHFLDQKKCRQIISSGLDRITISLDGTDRETYSTYRVNGDFDKVVNGIKTLVAMKKVVNSKKPFIEIQFLVMKHNEHQTGAIKKLGKDLGVDRVVLKSAQIYNYAEKKEKITNLKKYSRYIKRNNEVKIKNRRKNRCFRIWSSAVVTWDGFMAPCCFDKDVQYSAGDLNKSSVKDSWQGNNFMKFREQILQNRKQIYICNNCTEGLFK